MYRWVFPRKYRCKSFRKNMHAIHLKIYIQFPKKELVINAAEIIFGPSKQAFNLYKQSH